MRMLVLPLLLWPALVYAQPGPDQLGPEEPPLYEPIKPPPAELELRTAEVDAAKAKPEAPVEPPRPLLMPELVARKRLDLLFEASTGGVVNLFSVGIAGAYAFDQIEVFGDVRGRGLRDLDNDSNGGFAFGNIKLGARWNVPIAEYVVAPSLTMWLPTSAGKLDDWNTLTRMQGVADGRAYINEFALGVGVAGALHRGRGFLQVEGGAAFVADGGPQVASIFVAGGVGRQFTPKLALVFEWRFEMFPIDEHLNGLGFGMIRGTGDTRLRLRFHPYATSDVVGGACGIDVLRRFP